MSRWRRKRLRVAPSPVHQAGHNLAVLCRVLPPQEHQIPVPDTGVDHAVAGDPQEEVLLRLRHVGGGPALHPLLGRHGQPCPDSAQDGDGLPLSGTAGHIVAQQPQGSTPRAAAMAEAVPIFGSRWPST